MKNLIVANWKLNPATSKGAKQLFDAVKASFVKASAAKERAEVVICPPSVYLPILKAKPGAGLYLGAQNLYFEEKGAFTGEISALQLTDLNVEYVIVGHSERRKYFSETNETINKKIKKALEVGLKVIFCIGEKDGENKEEVLKQQIDEGLAGVENISNIVIAYEPVWAIGTGKNCSIEDTKNAVVLIKETISNLYQNQQVLVLYGGSVNSTNSGEYLKSGVVNGLLVGGASLNAEEFIKIVKSAE